MSDHTIGLGNKEGRTAVSPSGANWTAEVLEEQGMRTFTTMGAMVAALAAAGGAYAAEKAGVVNIPVVSERYAKTTDLEAQFDATRQRLSKQKDEQQDRINRLKRSLQEELKPGTAEFEIRKKEIAFAEAELQWFVETEGQKVERGLAQSLRIIYEDIQAIVREIAIEKKLGLVLAGDQLPAGVPDSPTQVRQHILLQKVLDGSADVDITEGVVTRLDARSKASQPAGTGNPQPAPPSGGGKPNRDERGPESQRDRQR